MLRDHVVTDKEYEAVRQAVMPYLSKLAVFTTAHDIRKFLASEEIVGNAGSVRCPIAQYIQRGSGHVVAVCRTRTAAMPSFRHITDHTAAMAEFVTNFDWGMYPELVEGPLYPQVSAELATIGVPHA